MKAEKSKAFLEPYFDDLARLIRPDESHLSTLIAVAESIRDANGDRKKTMIFGNGGSAAIASHFSVDLTKNARVRATNYNESDLITCFANDFGYENWVEKTIEFYGDPGDVLILISSSGRSQNMLNAALMGRKIGLEKIVTFTGMDRTNPLSSLGDYNLWVNSSAYNHVENVHQIWLLAIVDLLIGSAIYSP